MNKFFSVFNIALIIVSIVNPILNSAIFGKYGYEFLLFRWDRIAKKKKYTLYKVHEKNQPYLFFGMMHNAIALQFSQFLIFNILKPTVFTHSLVCYLILKKKKI